MELPARPPTVDLLGVRVHDVTEDEALDLLLRFIQKGGSHTVMTPNPEIVMAARHDPEFRAILNRADLSIPDGVGLLLASRWLGTPLRAHVRGTDLVLRLAAATAPQGARWFLLGAEPGVANAAGTALAERFPGLQIVGAIPGSPDATYDLVARAAIRAAAPVHVILVAYGAPKQEQWIARNREAMEVPVQMGVGGVLNFLAGRSPRAPQWVRRLELEWLYRLATEPWRWRRQLALPRFAVLAALSAITRRSASPT